MSLYSQSQVFGGHPFPAQYTQPTMGYHYGSLPPPVYHVDPNTFRRDYTMRLAELTINSRPIIQNLSMLAQDYVRFAEIVAQCIEAHIRRVSFLRLSTPSLPFGSLSTSRIIGSMVNCIQCCFNYYVSSISCL
jgi:hypothetical protein